MKLVRIIKICLNETYSKVRIGKMMSFLFTMIIIFTLCFRICQGNQ